MHCNRREGGKCTFEWALCLRSLRHDDILFQSGHVIHELSHRKVWLPMPLCICERNTRFSIGIWGKVVASTCWIAAVFASVVDIEVSLGIQKS